MFAPDCGCIEVGAKTKGFIRGHVLTYDGRMARPTRLDLEGGWYHALNRGIERRSIFKSAKCYSHFVELLSQLPKRFGLPIHGYVRMADHH